MILTFHELRVLSLYLFFIYVYLPYFKLGTVVCPASVVICTPKVYLVQNNQMFSMLITGKNTDGRNLLLLKQIYFEYCWRLFQRQRPKSILSNGSFPTVQFPKRHLPKFVIASALVLQDGPF